MGVGVGTHSQGDPITADYNQRTHAQTLTQRLQTMLISLLLRESGILAAEVGVSVCAVQRACARYLKPCC